MQLSDFEDWILPLVAAIGCYGVGQGLAKQFQAGLPAGGFILLYLALKVVANGIALTFAAHPPLWGGPATSFMHLALLANICSALGWICYFLALETGKIALVGTLSATYPVLAVLLAGVYLGGTERLTPLDYSGVALVMVAMGLMAGPLTGDAAPTDRRWLWYCAGAAAIWGLATFLGKMAFAGAPPGQAGWEVNYQVANMVALAALLLPYGLYALGGRPITRRALVYGLVPTGLFVIGDACIYRATMTGPVSLVAPLFGIYPIVTLIYVAMVLDERLGRSQVAAIALTAVALALITADLWLP